MEILAEIVTISEAARMWHKHNLTVRRAIDAGRIPLKARKTDGGDWLITVESCCQRWGEPNLALSNHYNN